MMLNSMTRSLFEVTGPNSGGLLTLSEAKAALGIPSDDTSRDADVNRLVARVSAAIYRACNLRGDGMSPPTLLSEEITETFRYDMLSNPLPLSRRRVTDITVTENGAELVEGTDYEIKRGAGQVLRLDSTDAITDWPSGKIIVDYVAGLETVPDDLKLATEFWMRTLWRDIYQTPSTITDPFVKTEDIPGVRRIERWVPEMKSTTTGISLVPPEVESILCDGGYVELWIA